MTQKNSLQMNQRDVPFCVPDLTTARTVTNMPGHLRQTGVIY